MPENNKDNDAPHNTKHNKKHVWLAFIIVVLAAIIAYLAWSVWNSKSVEQRLAEIEAARAIPDSENAATIYNDLLEKYDPIPLRPYFLSEDAGSMTLDRPWTAADYPELAEWIKDRQPIIDRLLHASGFDECRFPFTDYTYPLNPGKINRFSAMRGWTFLLARAANNDIAEGRIDNAIAKHRCIIQLARHLYQQPVLLEYLIGFAIESVGVDGLYILLAEADLTESRIKTIEQIQPTTLDNWADISATIYEVDSLISNKTNHPLARLRALWSGTSVRSLLKRTHDIHLRTVSNRRALKIITELRRYRNRHGFWPTTLDEIKSFAPPEVFLDPISGDSFVYKLADDTFTLYSKGKNKIDEDGQLDVTVDPNTNEYIEPGDDRLFWP
ncbi:MAG: heme exporter protein CcmD [Sedimentisphaerales bacterium]|nr:heme exporter protein CcmD [Sedimentisphaerales bacterium]